MLLRHRTLQTADTATSRIFAGILTKYFVDLLNQQQGLPPVNLIAGMLVKREKIADTKSIRP